MGSSYTYSDIVMALQNLGISKGDDVFVHSNLGFFGRLEGCHSSEELSRSFLYALSELVGNLGTIVIPTYSYSFCHGEVYNPYETKSPCGMLSNYMVTYFPESRTMDPNFSVCAVGNHQKDYFLCNTHESFGRNCFWDRFLDFEGKILFMNVHLASTMIHYIERKNNVSYRYNKAFNGIYLSKSGETRDYAVHFVYDGIDDAPAVERIHELCEKSGMAREEKVGKGYVRVLSARNYDRYFSALLKERPRILCQKEF